VGKNWRKEKCRFCDRGLVCSFLEKFSGTQPEIAISKKILDPMLIGEWKLYLHIYPKLPSDNTNLKELFASTSLSFLNVTGVDAADKWLKIHVYIYILLQLLLSAYPFVSSANFAHIPAI
jgi:hypothetical protein